MDLCLCWRWHAQFVHVWIAQYIICVYVGDEILDVLSGCSIRIKDMWPYIFIYVYMCIYIYIYMYIHVYVCIHMRL